MKNWEEEEEEEGRHNCPFPLEGFYWLFLFVLYTLHCWAEYFYCELAVTKAKCQTKGNGDDEIDGAEKVELQPFGGIEEEEEEEEL